MDGTPKRLYPNKRFKVNVNTPFKSPLIRKGKSNTSPSDSVVPTLADSPPDNLDSTPVKFTITNIKHNSSITPSRVHSTPTKLKKGVNSTKQCATPVKPTNKTIPDSAGLEDSTLTTPIKALSTPSKETKELEFKINQLKSVLTFLKTDKELLSLTEKWRTVCKSILVEYKPISEFCLYHSIDLKKFPDYDPDSDDFI
ncbi:hypothetical protein HDV06_003793 [Boothiomyces sp. JEL0866]|nr:hypothetical protein HDV06_003793 [Boothiomyces sp. JEL0866]